MLPSSYYRRYSNSWMDRPSWSLLDDPFFFRSTSSMPYYMRPRLSALDGGDNATRTESSEVVTQSVNNAINSSNVADEKTGKAEVSNQKDKFVVSVDVSHFAPHEIQVKVSDNVLVIEANHDEKLDEHGGFVTRSFKRRYEVPPDANATAVASDLNNDGILTVTAPKLHVEPPKERVIAVRFAEPERTRKGF